MLLDNFGFLGSWKFRGSFGCLYSVDAPGTGLDSVDASGTLPGIPFLGTLPRMYLKLNYEVPTGSKTIQGVLIENPGQSGEISDCRPRMQAPRLQSHSPVMSGPRDSMSSAREYRPMIIGPHISHDPKSVSRDCIPPKIVCPRPPVELVDSEI